MILTFMIIFGVGSALGMCAMDGLLGVPLVMAGRKEATRRVIRYAVGAFSIAIGTMILLDSGVAILSGSPAF